MSPEIRCAHDELVLVPDLKPNPDNPNKHDAAQLTLYAKILIHQGWRKALTVSNQSGFIVTGHGAWLTAKAQGWPSVPVDYQDFANRADEIAHMIADNKLAQMAELDDVELARVIKAELDGKCDLDLTGLDLEGLREIGAVEPEPIVDAPPQIDRAEELRIKWGVERGQLWELGEHRLLCGDALDPESWKRLGGPFRLCFADPPYELAMNANSLRCAGDGDLLLMATDKLFLQQSAEAFRTFFVLHCAGVQSASWTTTPLRQHTLIGWWRWQARAKADSDFRGCNSVFSFASNHESGAGHKDAKPPALLASLLPFFTETGEGFGDAFSGGGSAFLAAEQLGRKCCGVELSPANCAVILDRCQEAKLGEPKKI